MTDTGGAFAIGITGVTQDKPVTPVLFCRNATVIGSTTFVRTTNEQLQGAGGLLYSSAFKATDKGSGQSCTRSATVCVQDLLHAGKECLANLESYDATKCPRL